MNRALLRSLTEPIEGVGDEVVAPMTPQGSIAAAAPPIPNSASKRKASGELTKDASPHDMMDDADAGPSIGIVHSGGPATWTDYTGRTGSFSCGGPLCSARVVHPKREARVPTVEEVLDLAFPTRVVSSNAAWESDTTRPPLQHMGQHRRVLSPRPSEFLVHTLALAVHAHLDSFRA